MEISQLKYVVAVAELRSFSKAAEKMYITQPTISQQIRKLENEIGFSIFERSTKHVVLTEDGREFLEITKTFLGSMELFQEKIGMIKNQSSKMISVGILPTFSHLNILDYLHSYQLENPDYSFTIQIKPSAQLYNMLMDSKLDIIVANLSKADMTDSNLIIYPLFHDRVHAILSKNHHLSKRTEISFSDLAVENLIILDQQSSLSKSVNQAIRSSSVKINKILEVPEIYAMIGMVQSDSGVGFLSSMVYEAYKSPQIISIPVYPKISVETSTAFLEKNKKKRILQSLSHYINLKIQDQ